MANERNDIISWLGSVRPRAFAWYGLFLIEIAVASLIFSVAYEIYSSDSIKEIIVDK